MATINYTADDVISKSQYDQLGFIDKVEYNAKKLGKTAAAPVTGAYSELTDTLSNSLVDMSQAGKESLINVGTGAGESSYQALHGIALGVRDIGTIGIGEGIGSGLEGVGAGLGKGLGTGLEEIGTGAGKGVQNLAWGLIPAALIFIVLIVGVAAAKKTMD